jgi:hypothetical protein
MQDGKRPVTFAPRGARHHGDGARVRGAGAWAARSEAGMPRRLGSPASGSSSRRQRWCGCSTYTTAHAGSAGFKNDKAFRAEYEYVSPKTPKRALMTGKKDEGSRPGNRPRAPVTRLTRHKRSHSNRRESASSLRSARRSLHESNARRTLASSQSWMETAHESDCSIGSPAAFHSGKHPQVIYLAVLIFLVGVVAAYSGMRRPERTPH